MALHQPLVLVPIYWSSISLSLVWAGTSRQLPGRLSVGLVGLLALLAHLYPHGLVTSKPGRLGGITVPLVTDAQVYHVKTTFGKDTDYKAEVASIRFCRHA